MTYGGDFIPAGDMGDAPEFPKLFGLSLTPTVNGARTFCFLILCSPRCNATRN
jgi:hypothetical protein